MKRLLFDTSALIGGVRPPADVEAAISVASIAELHFGVALAPDGQERSRRLQRLGSVEAAFEPIEINTAIAREWGALAAVVTDRGAQPRRRVMDLWIAATARVLAVPLLTSDDDLSVIDDLVDLVAI